MAKLFPAIWVSLNRQFKAEISGCLINFHDKIGLQMVPLGLRQENSGGSNFPIDPSSQLSGLNSCDQIQTF
jgi:hypothetical protein